MSEDKECQTECQAQAEADEKMGIGLPFAKEIKMVQDIVALIQFVQHLDSNSSGAPDYADVFKIILAAVESIKTFMSNIDEVKTGELAAETKKFVDQLKAYFNEAEALISHDIKLVGETFPDLVKLPEVQAAIMKSTAAKPLEAE